MLIFMPNRFFLACFLAAAISSTTLPLHAQTPVPTLTEDQQCLQVLNRITFGPKPGDLDRVKKMGVRAFIEEQLDPEKIDDSACEKDLAAYPLLHESTLSLYLQYPHPAIRLFRPDLKDKVYTPAEEAMGYEHINEIATDLTGIKLTRAVESNRQLYEVMADFWFNHFNVAFSKDGVQWLVPAYEKEAIRPHAMGKFLDLLTAVAKSPAMLIYLDNNTSLADPKFKPQPGTHGFGGGMMMQNAPGQGLRLNENYARELMELHTLGVDGGYTQKDVIEAARVLTGWGVKGLNPDTAPGPIEFEFKPWHHDTNLKTVLGHSFGPDEGVKEGEQLLDMLSRQPATARFISRELCQRFVADNPPSALVKRVADVFLRTDGDIKETLRAIFESPEFLDPRYYRAKVKTPFEYVASALRAVDAHSTDWGWVDQNLDAMGEPLYRCEPPTGYPQVAALWVSSSAILSRANFATRLFAYPGKGSQRFSLEPFKPEGSENSLNRAFDVLLDNQVSGSTRKALETQNIPSNDPQTAGALVLSSPDFQRR